MTKTARMEPGVKLRDADKMALIPVKVLPTERDELLRKPEWLKIKLPLAGWLAGSQISRISCDQGRDLLIELGLPTIIKLGKKAANGYQKDAETLVKMSPYIDGIVEENYATVIVQWANQNPKFLVAILDRQSPTIHRAVLSSLDFGLGTNTNERQNLEKFMQNISPKSLTYVDWYRRNPVYP